ncbi:MAG: hypothetical protein ACSHYA_11655 [Opitutaceae bacterium]
MKSKPTEAACNRCGQQTPGKLDGAPLCDDCYSVFGACCASEFEDDEVLCDQEKPRTEDS